jgi:hypothetical protein
MSMDDRQIRHSITQPPVTACCTRMRKIGQHLQVRLGAQRSAHPDARGPWHQSRSTFKRACATAAWPDALQ